MGYEENGASVDWVIYYAEGYQYIVRILENKHLWIKHQNLEQDLIL